MESVVHTSKVMVDAASVLDVPVVVTEQYPKALGHTVAELEIGSCGKAAVFEKKLFSMVTPEVDAHLDGLALGSERHAVIFGIEAHVCVLQTVLDLLERDWTVHVCCDGVSSQREVDRSVAFERLKQSGAFLTTSESILFQLLRSAENENLKKISSLMKRERPTNFFSSL